MIAKARSINQQQPRYKELHQMLNAYCANNILPFDEEAMDEFQRLWLMNLRVSTMDLKIASITIRNNATLLTCNSKDFQKIPGLSIEDWSI